MYRIITSIYEKKNSKRIYAADIIYYDIIQIYLINSMDAFYTMVKEIDAFLDLSLLASVTTRNFIKIKI